MYAMFGWPHKKSTSSVVSTPSRPAASISLSHAQERNLDAVDQDLAVDFLFNTPTALPLSRQDASIVARYLLPKQYAPGEVLLQEGDTTQLNYMLWILDGEATIEAVNADSQGSITMTVLEPGSTLGQMGLIDGSPRSATCTATSTVRCAMLTRQSLKVIAAKHPEIGVKLMAVICVGVTSRLRDLTSKFKRYVMMTQAMSQELRDAQPTQPGALL
jgi:CRP/FNR family transcriptional regulator, cyclic AMP receptor protein